MDRQNTGVSLVEMLVVTAITAFLFMAVFTLLHSAQSNFFNADTSIDVRNSLRQASERVSLELRNTGYSGGVAQFSILDANGVNNSDVLRFSVPILCSSSSSYLNASGNPSYWGAPLTWGCESYTCMDANNSCATIEYKYIQYSINSSNQLERKVLDGSLNVVSNSTKIIAQNITDFQVSVSNNEITFAITAVKRSVVNRSVSMTYTNKVLINNLGG